jgi:hypothetical protein
MSADHKRLIDAAKNPSAALDYEIAQEIAATLGRLGRKLEHALGALTAFDAADKTTFAPDTDRRAARRSLVADARKALWNFVVQRETCGLRDARQVMIDYRVPPEVQQAVAVPQLPRRMTR